MSTEQQPSEGGPSEGEGESGPPDFVTPGEVRNEWSVVERVRAALGIDDDFAAAMVSNQIRLGQLLREMKNAVSEIGNLQDDEIIGEFPLDMSHSVPANTPDTDPHVVTRVPDKENDVRLTSVSLGWPDGTNNAVGIQVRTGNGQKLVPRNPEDEFIAFNDFTETFDLRYRLNPGEKLKAYTVNFDGTNDHFVNIVPQVEELPADDDAKNTTTSD